jgi:hypothetical protein
MLTTMLSQAVCAQGGHVSTTVQELSSLTRLTQLHIRIYDHQPVSSSLQCLSALCQLHDLDIDVLGQQDGLDWTTAPPLSHCRALTRLRWPYVPTEVHTESWHSAHIPAGFDAAVRPVITDAHLPWALSKAA